MRRNAQNLHVSRKKALSKLHADLPKSRIRKTDSTDKSTHQVPQSKISGQTRLSTFEFLPGDQGVVARVSSNSLYRVRLENSKEATGRMSSARSNLGRSQSPVHLSNNRERPCPSARQAPNTLPSVFRTGKDGHRGPLVRPMAVYLSPKRARSVTDPRDDVRLRAVQTPRMSGANEVYFQRADLPRSVNPLIIRAGTELWLPGTEHLTSYLMSVSLA